MSGAPHISSKLLIINSLSGGGGFRLGRILSCHEKVYWYSHPDNGSQPWTFATTDAVKETAFSRYHYDRILPDGTYLPLIGSRIEKYWDNEGWLENWHATMRGMDLPAGYLTYIVHDSPAYLRKRFPDSLIFNLIGDANLATKRHMMTSANFRIDYAMDGQLPTHKSEWVKDRDALLARNPTATVKDLWMYKHGGTLDDYEACVFDSNKAANIRNMEERSFADVTLEWDSVDPSIHTGILGRIDERYETLMLNDSESQHDKDQR